MSEWSGVRPAAFSFLLLLAAACIAFIGRIDMVDRQWDDEQTRCQPSAGRGKLRYMTVTRMVTMSVGEDDGADEGLAQSGRLHLK